MKFFTYAALIAVAAANAECTDDNVVAKKKARDEAKAALAETDKALLVEGITPEKKAELEKTQGEQKKKLEGAEGDLIVAQNTCTPGDAAPEPIDAQSQLSKSANSKAVADIKEWGQLTLAEAKQKDKFDAMDADAQKKWTDARALKDKAVAEREAAEKLAVGFDKLTTEQQTVYLGGLLAWRKEQYKKCQAAPESDECKYGDKLRMMQVKKRASDYYYAKTKEERTKDDAAATAAAAAELKELVAAAKLPEIKPEVKPGALAVGASCKKNEAGVRPTCAEGHCCGKASKGFFGESKDVCDVKTNTKHTSKNLEGVAEEWTFSCITGAKHIAAGIASAAVASFMMA